MQVSEQLPSSGPGRRLTPLPASLVRHREHFGEHASIVKTLVIESGASWRLECSASGRRVAVGS